jgi:polar amino acid transport system permease protein
METIEALFTWLHRAHGINLTIGYDAYDRGHFISGLATTIKLSLLCILFSLVIGVAGAAAQGARSRIVRWLVGGYIAFFRNTPPLIQL